MDKPLCEGRHVLYRVYGEKHYRESTLNTILSEKLGVLATGEIVRLASLTPLKPEHVGITTRAN